MEEAFDGTWEVGDDGLHLAALLSALLCSPDGGAPIIRVVGRAHWESGTHGELDDSLMGR